VRVVHDGMAAYEAAVEEHPDIAFLDIGMPALNGYELARKLRSESSEADLTLVAITGWGQESDRLHARQAGFDHHLVKPVEFERVLDLLRERAAA